MEFHMMRIMYVALPMCLQTEKTTFSCKDNCTLTKHTALDIFHFAVFLLWEVKFLGHLDFVMYTYLSIHPKYHSINTSYRKLLVDRFSPILPAPQGEVKTKSINKLIFVSWNLWNQRTCSVKGVLLDACRPEELPKNKYKMAHNLPRAFLS